MIDNIVDNLLFVKPNSENFCNKAMLTVSAEFVISNGRFNNLLLSY